MSKDTKNTDAEPAAKSGRRRTVLLAFIAVALLAFGLFAPIGNDTPIPTSKPAVRRAKKPPAPGPKANSQPSAATASLSSAATEVTAAMPPANALATASTETPAPTAEPVREMPDSYAGPGAPKPGSAQSPMEALREPGPEPPSPVPTTILAKIRRYAESVVARWDTDGDRRLSATEWRQMPGDPSVADLNGDGQLEAQEIAARVAVYSRRRLIRLMPGRVEPVQQAGNAAPGATPSPNTPSNEPSAAEVELARRARQFYVPDTALPSGLPQWFVASDANGDAQVSMAEFSAQWSGLELDRFKHYDSDGDGLITMTESVAAGGTTAPPTEPPTTDSAATP